MRYAVRHRKRRINSEIECLTFNDDSTILIISKVSVRIRMLCFPPSVFAIKFLVRCLPLGSLNLTLTTTACKIFEVQLLCLKYLWVQIYLGMTDNYFNSTKSFALQCGLKTSLGKILFWCSSLLRFYYTTNLF